MGHSLHKYDFTLLLLYESEATCTTRIGQVRGGQYTVAGRTVTEGRLLSKSKGPPQVEAVTLTFEWSTKKAMLFLTYCFQSFSYSSKSQFNFAMFYGSLRQTFSFQIYINGYELHTYVSACSTSWKLWCKNNSYLAPKCDSQSWSFNKIANNDPYCSNVKLLILLEDSHSY